MKVVEVGDMVNCEGNMFVGKLRRLREEGGEEMTDERQETVADIVAEMRTKRTRKFYPSEYGGGVVEDRWLDLADRIERAHGYELVEKYAGVVDEREGEILRLREALRKLLVVAKNRLPSSPTVDEMEIIIAAEAALAEAQATMKEESK